MLAGSRDQVILVLVEEPITKKEKDKERKKILKAGKLYSQDPVFASYRFYSYCLVEIQF